MRLLLSCYWNFGHQQCRLFFFSAFFPTFLFTVRGEKLKLQRINRLFGLCPGPWCTAPNHICCFPAESTEVLLMLSLKHFYSSSPLQLWAKYNLPSPISQKAALVSLSWCICQRRSSRCFRGTSGAEALTEVCGQHLLVRRKVPELHHHRTSSWLSCRSFHKLLVPPRGMNKTHPVPAQPL